MTRPLIVFGDPEAVVRARLVDALVGRLEPYVPTEDRVDVKFPGPDLDGGYVQIAHEYTPDADYPAKERAQVRVICWMPEDHRSDVKALASLTMAVLNACPSDDIVANIRTAGGRSKPTADPDTDYLMCWFLVRVNLRPQQLSS